MVVERCKRCGQVWIAKTTEEIDVLRTNQPCKCEIDHTHRSQYDKEGRGQVYGMRRAV